MSFASMGVLFGSDERRVYFKARIPLVWDSQILLMVLGAQAAFGSNLSCICQLSVSSYGAPKVAHNSQLKVSSYGKSISTFVLAQNTQI